MPNRNNTKYVILVGDGMADYPLKELNGKTPLEVAETPNMDKIASCRIGLVKSIPDGMEPGSDVANLSLLGYDPQQYHTGRAPLEAASLGVHLEENEVAYRMNLVTLDHNPKKEVIMVSHSSGDITTEESDIIVRDLQKRLLVPGITIYPGVAYRHLMIWDDGPLDAVTIPPHDMLDQDMSSYLTKNDENPVPPLIKKSWAILKDHPVNIKRRSVGLKEANSIWPWGQGKAPVIPPFSEKYGLNGGVISAVDLIKGIGIYAGFRSIHVEGATGYIDTNYHGKAIGALEGLEDLDFIFLHVEAPDEAGHNGDYKEKIQAIELFDRNIVGTVLKGLNEFEDYRIMVVSDHLTPIVKKTHTLDPTPFAWASRKELDELHDGRSFTETAAGKSGLMFKEGHSLLPVFLSSE